MLAETCKRLDMKSLNETLAAFQITAASESFETKYTDGVRLAQKPL